MADSTLLGETLIGHRIESVLGRGGMGVVYRARHERLNRVRALKLLPPELADDLDFRERFEREWRLAASIEHPNIVEVLDAGEAAGHLYILMRLIDGPDLATLIDREGPIPPRRALHLLEQVADALDAAHSQDLVHRDVTPRNILVAAGDRAFLADFGVARNTATRGLTRTGYFVGNLDYAAPEQIEGKSVDGRADIYALGGVLFTCLTGRKPYERESEVQLMYAQLNDPAPVPTTCRPDLPAALDDVVATAMAKSPDARFATCVELVDALRSALPEPAATVRETVPPTTGNGAPGKVSIGDVGRSLEGVELGDYRIEKQIGRGGMGIVYLAERLNLHSKVALKFLSGELASDDRFRNRFVRESQMASALDHPNIIPVYDAGELAGRYFIAMRYVAGPSLKELLERDGHLPLDRAVNLLAQVASALDTAHEHDLLHRDVKPANILIATGGASEFGEHVYLTDFGVSKRLGSHSGLTSTGQFIGTLSYAAPEQIEGKPVDRRADIYALGCVLYEMLAGVPPFVRDNDVALLWAHVHDAPPRLTEVRPDLPPALDEVIERAMSKSPEERPESCRDLVTAVRKVASDRQRESTVLEAAGAGAAATVLADPPTPGVATDQPVETAEQPVQTAEQPVQTAEQSLAPPPPPPPPPPAPIPPPPPSRVDTAGPSQGPRIPRKALLIGLLVLLVAGAVAGGVVALSSSSTKHADSPGSLGGSTGATGPQGPTGSGNNPPGTTLRLKSPAHDRVAVAGRTFGASATLLANGRPFTYARPECPGTLGGASLTGRGYAHLHGQVGCKWQLPAGSAGKKISGYVKVKTAAGQRFSATVQPAPKLEISKTASTNLPQPGSTYSVSFPVKLDDPGNVLAKTPSLKASCEAKLAGGNSQPATAKVSDDGSTLLCSWLVPSGAAGKSLRLQARVTGHGIAPATIGVTRTVATPPQPQPQPQPVNPPTPTPPPPPPPPQGPPPTVPD